MQNFTDEMKKALALAIHEGNPFFIHDGLVYEGDEADARAAYREWLADVDETETEAGFSEWLAAEGDLLPEYEEDDYDARYMVLTDEEADEKAREYIEESLWAFNPSFLAGVTGVDQEVFEAIQANDRCEGNNSAIARLVGDDLDRLVDQAIGADGRGHFLNTYDGHEHEINLFDVTGENEYFYVYRMN